jgi:acetyltransferase-like isoleucine patch superfamily enzyme
MMKAQRTAEAIHPNTHRTAKSGTRIVRATHGLRKVEPDPQFELDMAAHLKEQLSPEQVQEAFSVYGRRTNPIDIIMRRVSLRALVKSLGNGTNIRKDVTVIHPETFEIGDGVFLGEQTIIQGRFDGRCAIGNRVWIGPQSYFDARDLVIEDCVGWGPGAKVLGSEHIGSQTGEPVIQSDLRIAPVRICAGADVGMNAIILPGVTVGRGAIVGAGAVVTKDVPDYATAIGVPAQVTDRRKP